VRALLISISKQRPERGYALESQRSDARQRARVQFKRQRFTLKRFLSYSLTAATLSVGPVALTAADAASDQLAEATPTARIQHWVADHKALVDARLGYLTGVIRLTPDQNVVWEAFERAVRRGAKAHRMNDVRQRLEDHERRSRTERMDATAGVWLIAPTGSKRSLKPLNRCIAVSTIHRSASSSC
jgi:hypothetical protein